jgi:hypothetical protein
LAAANEELARLQKKVGPRVINREEFLERLRDKLIPPLPVEIVYSRDDGDSRWLASQLYFLLQMDAGWPVRWPDPLGPADATSYFSSLEDVGGSTSGITVVENAPPHPEQRTVGGGLQFALMPSLGQIAWTNADRRLPLGTVRVVIAPKPP